MRVGQKNKLTYRWARKGSRPRAAHDQRTQSTYLFGAVCPEHGTGAALVLPFCNTEAMQLHLDEIAARVTAGAHAILILDQAGWHGAKDLKIPSNLSLLPLPPRVVSWIAQRTSPVLRVRPFGQVVTSALFQQQCKQSPSFDHFDSGFPSKWLGDDCEFVMQSLISRSAPGVAIPAAWRSSPPSACCSPSVACPFVPTGCMRRHIGSAGRVGAKLPTDARMMDAIIARSGSTQSGSERGTGIREAPCGNHPSSSRAATMDSKAHSTSFGFPVSAAVTNAFPAFNQWARLKNPEGKSAISACWASRSLTIFRNGPLFGVMANVKCVSQSAIVRLDLR